MTSSSGSRRAAADAGPAAREIVEHEHRRVPVAGLEECGELGVGDEQVDVGVQHARPRREHELLDGPETKRERQHHDGGSGQPGRLDGGHERPGGWSEQGHVRSGADPTGLEHAGHPAGLVVDPGPADPLRGVGVDTRRADERDRVR
jgi:hypothetical protein